MSKDSVAISASASVLVDAYKHNKMYASTAEDAGTMDREGKYFCQRAINHSTMEMEGVQAASLVASLRSSDSSDAVHFYSGWDIRRLARIAAAGVIDDINFSHDVMDEDAPHESNNVGTDSDDEVNDMLRAVPSEALLDDRYKNTPTVDLLNNSSESDVARKGYAQVFRNSVNENIPVSQAHHYMYRDLKLWRFNAYEFARKFAVRSMTKEDRKWYDSLTAAQPVEPRRGVRTCHRFLLMPPHPLHDSHILVPRAKHGIPAFAGSSPPSDSASLLLDSIISHKKKRFAQFFVSNFVPWSAAQPPVLRYMTWTNHVNTLEQEACLGIDREPDILETTTQEDRAAILSAKRSRLIAAGRLFDIDNITKCFKVKRPAVVITAKHRGRARTVWYDDGSNKPPADAPVEMQRAANAIRNLQAKADRIHDGGDQASRLTKSAKASKWAAELRNALFHSRFQSRIHNTTPNRLKTIWAKAAFPTKQSLRGGIPNPRDITSLLKKPIVLQDSNEWNTSSPLTNFTRTGATALNESSEVVDPFAEIDDETYELAAEQHKASGLPRADAPLNPEQRACGRDMVRVALLRRDLTKQGLSPLSISTAVKRLRLSQITMMTGRENFVHHHNLISLLSCTIHYKYANRCRRDGQIGCCAHFKT